VPQPAVGQAGLTVVGVENRLVGGECPYYGCVPSKMMIAAAHALAGAVRVSDLVDTLRSMHFAHPTFHRVVETALADLG
jgi:pyruvate/2-oxoglutarate dehydrogenase complex dihydrolipoamide dehydrogenase (E3) component